MTGKEYRKRLESFSLSTIRMITKCNESEELFQKKLEIVTNPYCSEEQIVQKIEELLKSQNK